MELLNSFTVTEVKAKTKARLFKDVEVGDVLVFRIPLAATGRGRGCYAATVEVENIRSDQHDYYTLNELSPLLNRCFTLK